MKTITRILAIFTLVLSAISATTASAALIYTVDSGWQSFNWFGTVGSTSDEGGFEITSTGPVLITVTDTYAFGDEFSVFADGLLLGQTSDVAEYAALSEFDPDAAILAGFSHSSFLYNNIGTFIIDFTLFQDGLSSLGGQPFSNGGAHFRVDSVKSVVGVPVQGSLAILLMGVALIAMRKKTQKK